ncbi:class I SAM-dependent methyltransferase [Bradyrhizobium sp. CCBAU 51753]|uniref:class I SAM-dependent methyltransferase n=1 Tax=Bradyrhizobium sp. CCBAU 51753 TaxID=1325100 RepID=UPI001FEF32F4|nr:class I SAM-dependent methyltransferase [Bradyrhizobium sp. CCBAU 51753]
MLDTARQRDPSGDYRYGRAEQLEFPDASFDLVVSYITLVDIPDFRAAIREMARVLRPGGALLIANLTGFTSAGAEQGWVRDEAGRRLHFPVDRYLDEFPMSFAWAGIRIENWHRPLSAYMTALLEQGLLLRFLCRTGPGVRRSLPAGRFSPRAVVRRDGMAAPGVRVVELSGRACLAACPKPEKQPHAK